MPTRRRIDHADRATDPNRVGRSRDRHAAPGEAGDREARTSAESDETAEEWMSGQEDGRWMRLAVELAWQCPPSRTAYSVGAIIVGTDGTELSRGFSRENDPFVHAEESALGKLAPGEPRLAGATIYSTLEPCSQRKSRPRTCTQLIIASGIGRVVIAWREPSLFVADCQGYELLEQAGLDVTELPAFAEQAIAPNRHLTIP
jgi:diaminohydroxyphosphoribosylaminopyrimidine deaminase / 5-amino-6-(5-phosphoribosylamino)uracil reductase